MSVRPHPSKGAGWWVIDYYPSGRKGKRVVVAYKGSKGAALALEQDLRRGPSELKNKVSPLIRDLVAPWLEYYKTVARPLTNKDAISSLAHLLPRFGLYKPANITRQTINDYKMARLLEVANPGAVERGREARPVSKRTVSKELSYLSSLLRWASEMDFCPEMPFTIRGFPAKQTRADVVRPLAPRQLAAILEASEPAWRPAVAIQAFSGIRTRGNPARSRSIPMASICMMFLA
jgi:integrase/recombinase XerD